MRRYFVLFLIMFCVFSLNSQNPYFFGVRSKYGFILAHHPEEMSPLITKNVPSLEFRFGWQTLGRKPWQIYWAYPMMGIAGYYAPLGNDTLGKAWALFGFTDLPIIRKKKYQLILEFDLGSAYVTRPYDPEDNPDNIIIGTYINIYANTGLKNLFIFDNWAFFLGFSLNHYSNGGVQMPNYGINILGVNGGVYYLLENLEEHKNKPKPEFEKYWDITAIAMYGQHNEVVEEPRFDVYELALEVGYHPWAKSKFFSGLDIGYSKRAEFIDQDTGLAVLQLAPSIGYAAVFDKVEFVFKWAYRVKKYSDEFPYYQVYGFRAEFLRNLVFNVSLNTFWFNAQHIQVGVGYRWRSWYR